MKVKIDKLNKEYLNEVTALVLNTYKEEISSVPFLPFEDDFKEMYRKQIKKLISEGTGIVAKLNNKIVGFLAGYRVEEFWGKAKGIYCPDYGHGVIKKNKKKIYQKLYKNAAKLWVNKGYTHHALTIYAHDKKAINTFFWLGFGLRCIDAMRKTAVIGNINPDISIKKIGIDNIADLAEIQRELHEYFNTSPIFMPVDKQDPIKYLTEWLKKENHHIWEAFNKNNPLAFMKIEPLGERLITKHESVMNITGAYVKEEYQNSQIGFSLLGTIQKWLLNNDYNLCGVDYESFNIKGSNFWNKHFVPYTYSMVRRIDERVL